MRLRDLLSGVTDVSGSWPELEIRQVTADSREVMPGSLFVCVKGQRTDGHDHAAEAVKRGAVALLAERTLACRVPVIYVPDTAMILPRLAAAFYGFPTDHLRVIGVTGTNGKTTTTYLLEAIFSKAGHRPAVIGTIQYRFEDRVMPASHTTPPPLALQRVLSEFYQAGATHVVMEVSSHALAMGRVDGCEFDGAVFTNLTQDHLDFHGTLEAYGEAKRLLFKRLGEGSRKSPATKYAVVNADDPFSARMIEGLTLPIWKFGMKAEVLEVRASAIQATRQGLVFRVDTPLGSAGVTLSLRGRHNVENALAALTCAMAERVPLEVAVEALRTCRGAPGRLEWIDEGQPFMVVVDYAHTPDALQKTLEAVSEFRPRRIITVFGCGGDRDKGKRPLMGRIATERSHLTILTSDNPRSESPEAILDEIQKGLAPHRAWIREPDREKAIARALQEARPDDLVLIAGKGHETYQIIGNQVLPFDDREVARRYLRREPVAGLRHGTGSGLAGA